MTTPDCLRDPDVCWWPIERLPDDYQILSRDFYDDIAIDDDGLQLVALPSRLYELTTVYEFGLLRQRDYWGQHDFEKMDCYREAILAGDIFPPLILENGHLQDGYHRGNALLELERLHFEAIELCELIELQRFCRDAGDPAGRGFIGLSSELVRRRPWGAAHAGDLLVG